MDLFKGIDIGVYSTFRHLGQDVPVLADVASNSAFVGSFLWTLFLAILVWRWWSILGRFPTGNLVKLLLLFAVVEALAQWLDRKRPPDSYLFFNGLAELAAPFSNELAKAFDVDGDGFFHRGFPNGPTFRAVLISALMWETAKPGWGERLGLGAVLYCVWVMMGQLMAHLAFLTDVLASLSLALGIACLSPRIFVGQASKLVR